MKGVGKSHEPGKRARPGDQGLATVWVAMTTATLCAAFAVVLALGQAVAARHKAAGAADLAALAAADRALSGASDACGAARRVAGAQGAEVVRCAILGEIADVTARARFGPYTPQVRSRAGPPVTGPSSSPSLSASPPAPPPLSATPLPYDQPFAAARHADVGRGNEADWVWDTCPLCGAGRGLLYRPGPAAPARPRPTGLGPRPGPSPARGTSLPATRHRPGPHQPGTAVLQPGTGAGHRPGRPCRPACYCPATPALPRDAGPDSRAGV
ncbi:Rv3654c family TadE-like protein [Streptomyces sp. NBC_00887]|uniref:Rv3654c family TadE-like protein n=1 Tax=Streptomyces sp. NBC_00887 TaxID=2975859 RepID=UPI00386DDC54